jgi:branched-chain amino acid transport system permease protein
MRMQKDGWRRHQISVGIGVLAILIIVLGWIETSQPMGLKFADITGGIVTFDTLVRVGILTIVVVGLNLLMGHAGQISLGQAGFYAIGAYVSAIMTTRAVNRGINVLFPGAIPDTWWWWPWLMMLAGMVITGGIAYLIGKPILRLRGHYLAMGTLGVGLIIYILFREGSTFTGAFDGIASVPRLAIGSFEIWPRERYYFLVWAVALVVMWLSLNIVSSRVGRALRAIEGSELAAHTMGVDIEKFKLQVFVLSTVYASIAGSLYAHYQTLVNPAPFGFVGSLDLVIMAALGGLASIWGAAFGVGIIFVIKEVLRARLHQLLHGAGGEHEIVVFGILLVLIMIFMPQGLSYGATKAFGWFRGQWVLRRGGEKEVEPQVEQVA